MGTSRAGSPHSSMIPSATSKPPQRLIDVDITSGSVLGYDKHLFVEEVSRPVVPSCSLLPELCELRTSFYGVSRSDDAVKAADIRWIEILPIRYLIIVSMLMLVLATVSVEVLNLQEPARLAPGERLDAYGQVNIQLFDSGFSDSRMGFSQNLRVFMNLFRVTVIISSGFLSLRWQCPTAKES